MRELKPSDKNARKDKPTDAFAMSGNSSFPQLDCQSSMRTEAEDDADMRR